MRRVSLAPPAESRLPNVMYRVEFAMSRVVNRAVLDDAFPTSAPVNVVLTTDGTLSIPEIGRNVNSVAVRRESLAPASESIVPKLTYRVLFAASRCVNVELLDDAFPTNEPLNVVAVTTVVESVPVDGT